MRPRVVIVGAGFGGLWVAKTLANAALEVVVIDRQNYHLFQPLLYQVATAGLSPADIAAPIRSIVGTYRNITVMLGEVNGVDVGVRAVFLEGGGRVPYGVISGGGGPSCTCPLSPSAGSKSVCHICSNWPCSHTKATPGRLTGVIPRHTGSANLGSDGVY